MSEAGLELNPLFGLGLPPVGAVYALVEGLLLGAFTLSTYKSEHEEKVSVLRLLIGAETNPAAGSGRGPSQEDLEQVIRKAEIVAEAVNLAREWSHEPPNVINPVTLAERVQKMADETGLKCTILDDKQLAEIGAGAMVAVGKGSNTPARLIILEHAGGRRAASGAGRKGADHGYRRLFHQTHRWNCWHEI